MRMNQTALFASLLLGASGCVLAGPVTVYGTVDTGMEVYYNGDKTNVRVSSGLREGSNFGFMGSELLGNGTEVFYKIESTIFVDTGSMAADNRLFDREALVGIRGNYGSLSLGRQYTPHFLTMAMIDPAGLTMSSAANYFACPQFEGTINGYTADETTRFSNSISYDSPSFGGLTIQLYAALGEQTSANSNSPTRGNVYNIGFRYQSGPLSVMASYLHQNTAISGYADWDSYWAFGAAYDFEVIKPSILYVHREGSDEAVGSNLGGTNTAKSPDLDMVQLGASAPIGPGKFIATVGYLKNHSAEDGDAWAWGVRYDYPMSKKLTLYTGLTGIQNDDDAQYSIGGGGSSSPGEPVAFGDDPMVYYAGMTYHF